MGIRDWIDGLVARELKQCIVIGSGVKWRAGVVGQMAMRVAWSAWAAPFFLPLF